MRQKRKKRRSAHLIRFFEIFGKQGELFFEGLEISQRENAYFHLHDILTLTQFYATEDVSDVLSDCCSMDVFHRNTVKGLLSKKPLKLSRVPEQIATPFPSGVMARSLSEYKAVPYGS